MNQLLLRPSELQSNRARLTDERAEHVQRVLGARPGETVRIGLLNGPSGTGRIEHLDDEALVLTCRFDERQPPVPRLDLLLALPRPKVLRRLLEQVAAMGVDRLWITNAWKVEKCYFASHHVRPPAIEKALIRGLTQACCTRLPRFEIHKCLRPLVEEKLPSTHPRLLFTPRGEATPEAAGKGAERLLLAIGPEGGWIPDEIRLFERHGFATVTLGSRVLRTETATIAALARCEASLAAGG